MGFAKRQSLLAEEVFSNSMANVHADIPETLGRIVSIKTLTIDYTNDIELAKKVVRATDVRWLSIQTYPKGYSLN